MRFTLVIFNTYEFFTESLAHAKLAPSFFMSEKSEKEETLNIKALKFIGLSKFKNIFLLKEFFFTSPQLKITLFYTALLQAVLIFIVYKIIGHNKRQLIKRKTNVSI